MILRIAVVLMALLPLVTCTPRTDFDLTHWTYAEFIERVEDGSVSLVELPHYGPIRGTFQEDGVEARFQTDRAYSADDDPLLTRLLQGHQLTFAELSETDVVTTTSFGLFSGFLPLLILFFVPLVTVIVLFVVVTKLNRLQRSAGIGLVLAMALPLQLAGAEDITTVITYQQFIREVENGGVLSLYVAKFNEIRGNYRKDDARRSFVCVRPTSEAEDPLLLDLLHDHGVPVQLTGAASLDPIDVTVVSVLMYLPQVLAFILAVVLLTRTARLQKPGGSAPPEGVAG